ncbi:peroxisomal membrane protein PEX16-like [Gigantopelta aegis]|uniref:peroxisomal membrane protein PEX16-like n=1 Tax=Gigantopelta aegis TaxID=1735272 RepID=UPI001B887D13|nr:peroxisomal membrane protein PEX16-like [Gigantopelta aegis]
MADTLKNVYEKYKQSVRDHPDKVGQVETTVRLLSYLVAGRFGNSQVLSELMYTASNLLVLLNDAILKQKSKIVPKVPVSQERLCQLLTVLEYVEVFVEITAMRLWTPLGRWLVIAAIQIAKAALRFFLLVKYKSGIQPTPPIAPIDRGSLSMSGAEEEDKEISQAEEIIAGIEQHTETKSPVTFTLKRSGKTVRTISAAPAMNMRTWSLSNLQTGVKNQRQQLTPTVLNRQRVWAESIHIAKPLIHLASLYACGFSSWKPWLLSCGLDVTSLCMMGEPDDLNVNEKAELRRRTFMLLFYLLRSPFYDRYSQAKIIFLLKIFADNIPGMSLFIKPFMEYLPAWQKVYFYIWST